MDIKNTITHLIYLPKRFDALGNVSIYSLLQDTGYFNSYQHIPESAIREALHNHPECVDEWMCFSEGKRSSAGWYFCAGEKGYEVGYVSQSGCCILPTQYSDRIEACAAFIKYEIEDIRRGKY